ncbi:MAG: YbaB/EbfC family nucleoid-associated protein, partial [Desulfurobacteriaceae bacterium]
GAVKVVAKGTGDLVSVEIDEELFKSGDKEMLEDLIVAAANKALQEARETLTKELGKLTGGLGIDIGGLF